MGTDPYGQMTNAQSLESRQGVSCQELLHPPFCSCAPTCRQATGSAGAPASGCVPAGGVSGWWCKERLLLVSGEETVFRKYLRHESPSLELKNITQIRKFPEARESLHRTQLLQQSLAFEKQPLFLFRGDFPASPGTTRTHR